MSAILLWSAVAGATFGLGLLLIASGLGRVLDARANDEQGAAGGSPGRAGLTVTEDADVPARRWWGRVAGREPGAPTKRLLACAAVALLVGVLTRWPVAAVLAGCAAWALPGIVGPDRDYRRRLARIEAIATWTEMLRDTLSAAAGLEQAIVATAELAPPPIRTEVGALADRLRRGERLGDALRRLAGDLADPTGDLVTAALIMAAERHARHVTDLLSTLAAAARDQAGMRMRVAASRARIRTSVRVVVTVTLGMAAGLVLLNREFLRPYDTPAGQVVLAAVGLLFAAAMWSLTRIARVTEEPRILTGLQPHGAGPGRVTS